MCLINKIGFFLILINATAHAVEDGRWQLTISGYDKIEFGTEKLAGGLNVTWETVLEFSIKNSIFTQGTGTARFINDITTFSRPLDMFDCGLMNGVFSSRSGVSFDMPHLRVKAFPLSGKIIGETVQLNPFLEYPGNYYAVLYQCETSDSLGSFWIERSPRIARELSKRQNAQTEIKDNWYRANIKEVNSIAPGPNLQLPLVDGLKFSLTQQYGLRKLDYSLHLIAED